MVIDRNKVGSLCLYIYGMYYSIQSCSVKEVLQVFSRRKINYRTIYVIILIENSAGIIVVQNIYIYNICTNGHMWYNNPTIFLYALEANEQ